MLYIIIIAIIFSIIVSFWYTNSKIMYKHYFIMLLLSMLSLCCSLVCMAIFMIKDNALSSIVRSYFLLPVFLYNKLAFCSISRHIIVNILNISSLFYIFFSFAFFFYYLQSYVHMRRMKLWILAGTFLFVAEFALFSPEMYELIYQRFYNSPEIGASRINQFYEILHMLCFLINTGIIAMSGAISIYCSVRTPKFRDLKINAYCISFSYLLSAYIFLSWYKWFPLNLLRISVIAGNMKRYLSLPFRKIHVYRINLILLIVSLIILCIALIFQYRMNRNLRNEQFMLAKNIDIMSFVSRVFCHSLKNEILSIQAEIEMIEDQNMAENTKERLNDINRQCTQICDNLNAIYNTSKVQKMKFKSVDITEMISEFVEDMLPLKHQVQIQVAVKEKPLWCLIDSFLFLQALTNIFENSADAMKDTALPNRIIEIEISACPPWNQISILDHGTGIPKENLPKLFNPFYTTKGTIHNWGMGLNYVQKIIIEHEGKISIKSVQGEYTRVTILLPQFVSGRSLV